MEPGLEQNRLLCALSRGERARFLARSRRVHLSLSQTLGGAGKRIRHAYFPLDSCISISTRTAADAPLEIALFGSEGMLGIDLLLGVAGSAQVAVVRGEGRALRMEAASFRHEIQMCPGLARILKRYAHVLMVQLAQTATCTRFHVVQARLARLLLMTDDRVRAQTLQLTHEALAERLGVRRAGITTAAFALQRRALISYRRGRVTILDRDGLQDASCSCYATDNDTYRRVMKAGHAAGKGQARPSRAGRRE